MDNKKVLLDRQVTEVRPQYFFELRRLYQIGVKNAIDIINLEKLSVFSNLDFAVCSEQNQN